MKTKLGFIACFFSILYLGKINSQNNCNTFSTYFGGTQSDEVKSVCIDLFKNSYVIGNTYSADLPVTPGLINDTYSGGYDGYISKFDSCGALLWSTYFGGLNFDSAEKIIATKNGDIVFCGYTNSTNTFTSTGCFQPTLGGGYDCFVTKVSPNGLIIWSTYFGKSGGDFAFDIKTDNFDNIIIGGTTTSTSLYTTAASFQPNLKGNTDAFIARFSSAGQLKWCTYYGGNNSEDIHAITTDNNCNIIGAGGSFSTNLNTSSGAYQNTNDGSSDAYLIKLDSSGARIFSTYIGGGSLDDAWGITCDGFSNIYLAGHTNSNDFDTTSGVYQSIKKGLNDLYITKWSPVGSLLISTLFGGSAGDNSARLVLSSPYELTLLGKTESTDIPLIGTGTQTVSGGAYDLLMVKFNAVSLTPIWSSYFGGTQDEEAHDIVSFKSQFLEFCGSSNSIDYPMSGSAYQPILNNSVDGIISKINIGNLVPLSVSNFSSRPGISVFPNPFKNKIYIQTGTVIQKISCYNIFGVDLFQELCTDDTSILNTETLSPGLYVIAVFTEHSTNYFTLIK